MCSADASSDTKTYLPRLLAEREDLQAASERTASSRRPVALDQQSVGRLSRMDALQNQAMAQGTEARRRVRLNAIDAAIARLSADEFGYCSDCGERIGAKRLDLDPAVCRCIACAR